MKKPVWEPATRIEVEYQQSINKIGSILKKGLARLSSTDEMIRYLSYVMHTEAFVKLTNTAISRMVTGLAVDNAGDWRLAALKSTKGRLIFKLLRDEFNGPHGQRLRDLIIHNARLVKSLPLDVAESLLDHVKTEAIKGRRADDIMQDIKDRVPDIVDSKARLLARTEISKTSTAITRARSESIGLDWYVWRTSKDSRVRHSHEIMDGVLVKWTDPPSPERLASEPRTYGNYHAGEIFNCRCYPEPVIRLDTLTWPMKVYTGGRIVRMNRAQFEKLTA